MRPIDADATVANLRLMAIVREKQGRKSEAYMLQAIAAVLDDAEISPTIVVKLTREED